MIDPSSLTKRYYTISEVSEMLDVNNSLLRFWESEFKEIKPQKGSNGVRRYTVKDILLLENIHDLLKVRGFTIDGARKELKARKESKKKKVVTKVDTSVVRGVLNRLRRLREELGDS